MNPLLFQCQTTGRTVKTGLAIDVAALRHAQSIALRLTCPHCKSTHEWTLSEGMIGDTRAAMVQSLQAWSPCTR
jgi:hypothetical protein